MDKGPVHPLRVTSLVVESIVTMPAAGEGPDIRPALFVEGEVPPMMQRAQLRRMAAKLADHRAQFVR